MSDQVSLAAVKREIVGKKVRKLRREGSIPGTVYEKGKDSINVAVEYIPFSKIWESVGTAQPVELNVGETKILTMIKVVDVDPARNEYVHVAFHAINKNDPVEAEVPVHIDGDVPAEQQGNFLIRPNDHVLVKALPANLPEVLNVSAATLLKPGDHLTVADIDPIADVEILSEIGMTLATVEEPRAIEEVEEEVVVDAADVPSEKGGDTSDADSDEAK